MDRITTVSFLFASLIFVAHIAYSRLFFNHYKKGLPPKCNLSLFKLLSSLADGSFRNELFKQSRLIGPVFRLTSVSNIFCPTIICGDIDMARVVLTTMDKTPQYRVFNFLTNRMPSMFTKRTEKEGWSWARKGVGPSLSNSNIYQTIPALNQELYKLNDYLTVLSKENREFDIASLMVHFTIDFLTLSMFGECFSTFPDFERTCDDETADDQTCKSKLSPSTQQSQTKQISEGKRFLNELSIGINEVILRFDPFRTFRFWDKSLHRAEKAAKYLSRFCMSLLQRYRDKHTKEEIENDSSIMGHLMRTPYPSDEDRCADILTFLVAGHDTTGCALSWTILEIAKNPEISHKIHKELMLVNPDVNAPFDSTHLGKLEYLSNVVREGLRLWPSASVASSRVCEQDTFIKGYLIPKGSYVQVNSIILMRQGISWPDDFIPERWGDNQVDFNISDAAALERRDIFKQERDRVIDQFIPFSLGKRNCIGQNMALLVSGGAFIICHS